MPRPRPFLLAPFLALLALVNVAHASQDPGWSGSSPLALTLRGAYQTSAWGQAWVVDVRLAIGLDILTGGQIRREASQALAHEVEPGTSADAKHEPTSERTTSEQEPSTDASGSPNEERKTPARQAPSVALTSHLARSTVAAALRASGAKVNAKRLDELLSRARVSALLPGLQVRVGRNLDQTLRFAPTADDPTYYTTTGGTDWRFEARVIWQLDRLLYAKEELDGEKLRRRDEELGLERAKQTLSALVHWQRGKSAELDPDATEEEKTKAMLDRVEAEIRLDVLTNGWFSRHLERHAPPQAKRPSPSRKRKNPLAGKARRE